MLRTEADQRRLAISDPLFIERYGADTYGLIAYPEFGIGAFQADDVRAWANRRLLQELRHNRGLAYSPSVRYAIRDQDIAHVIAAADGLPDVHSTLVQAFIGEFERLTATAITEDEILSSE